MRETDANGRAVKMNLYLISQDENDAYDTYDSAVVIAENSGKAKMMHPSGNEWDGKCGRFGTWASVEHIYVKYIGMSESRTSGVVLSSFNSG